MIRNQEVLGLCEWLSAGGTIKEMIVDHFNVCWLATMRGNVLTHERMRRTAPFAPNDHNDD
ncbi:MAG: hypothetical protein U5K75_00110 [Ahrensia sp.]|nr:hypothetical protein [Ahrensia sp.]